jgi:transposase
MSETLVVIRTFDSLVQADEAQIELLNAGIYSLLLSDETVGIEATGGGSDGIALAVHRRDADVAVAVLTPLADTG